MGTLESYQACFDVKYYEDYAVIGYVLFKDHKSDVAFKTGQFRHEKIEPYIPGEFYKRELPCLLTAIKQIEENINLVFIDANVWLGDNLMGLGCYLYEALEFKIPVIGISKTFFHNAEQKVLPVLRANSTKPLFVSSIGLDIKIASKIVLEMHGVFRLPTMVKLADTMSRKQFS